ncbi:restriction endonuclease subunit S [Mesorhizobium sp.]|uniref:restriction endonuclease subunit S n=1 Tax=Mesorhizobium sp. TaxID=1871066 RepID=UPI000FEA0ED3|nr:restriction endonuclease subunit S [Mesorhizobium sp.]RWP94189.1 MAG: hypothetical protein EOR89_31415 [Mesorhizobium sp.]RWQ45916.1 MAG: hypothetical protein EOS82_23440 [Mesorhizobium sp.]
MSELPDGWQEVPLSEVTDKIGSGATPKGGHTVYASSGTPFIRSQNVHYSGFTDVGLAHLDDLQARKLDGVTVRSDDVLLNITGASIGRVTVAPERMDGARVNQHVAIIRPVEGIEAAFVARFLASPPMQQFIVAENYGVTRQALTKAMIEEIKLPLPPLPEQRRIVAKIDSLTGKSRRARDHLDHIPRLVEKYKQAVLAAAFRGDLTREWRTGFVDEDREWAQTELERVADVGTGATPKRGNARYYDGGTIPWVTSGSVNRAVVDDAEERVTENAIRETNCKVYPAGTLLMAMYGEGKTRGKVAVLGIAAATNQALAAIRVYVDGPADRNFVLWYLRSQYLELRDQAAGGVQPNLNLGIIKRLPLFLPPKPEQHQIVRKIEIAMDWIDRLASDATSARKLIDRLDQAVLAKAFRGEFVPQDPTDEPASMLLERIRAERSAAPKVKQGRRAKADA